MDNAGPAISVIVPVYRAEDYLDRCVRSLTEQTFSDIEILLVDDGSPDRCPALCDAWAARDGRVRVLHRENAGVSAARNRGLEDAAGRYIAFADADDWLEPDALAYLYALRERFDADFAFAYYRRTETEEPMPETAFEEFLLTRGDYLKGLFKDGTQAVVQYPWAKLFRRELFDGVRFPEGVTNGEDIPAAFALALRSERIACSTRAVYNYFLNPHGVTMRRFGEKNFDILASWDIVCRMARERDCGEDILRLAKLNRDRADFGVLCNLAMSPDYDTDRKRYADRAAILLAAVRQNAGELMGANMPLSRKLILAGFCVSYPATARLMNLGVKLRDRLRGGKGGPA